MSSLQKIILTKPYKILALLAWATLILIGSYIISKTDVRMDLSIFLPENPSKNERLLINQLQNGAFNRILLVGIEGEKLNSKALAKIAKKTANKIRKSSLFTYVHNGEYNVSKDEQKMFFDYRYHLSKKIDKNYFTVDKLTESINNTLLGLSSSAGLFSKKLLSLDPTGESVSLLENWLPDNGPTRKFGQWFNSSTNRAVMIIQLAADGDDIITNEKAITIINNTFQESLKELNYPTAKILISGPAVFAVGSRKSIESDIKLLATFSLLLIMTLLLYSFRSPKVILLILLPVSTGIIVGIVSVGMTFGYIHGLTLAFGITLIGESIDYTIYYLVQKSVVTKELKNNRFWKTIWLGLLTSICGFSVMFLSGFTGLSQLGLFSISGLIAAALVARFILPLLTSNIYLHNIELLGAVLQKSLAFGKYLVAFVLVLGTLSIIIILFTHKSIWNKGLGGLSPVPISLQKLDGELRRDMGAPDLRNLIIIEADSEEEALIKCEHFLPKMQMLVENQQISGFEAPCSILPSKSMQKKRIDAIPEAIELQKTLSLALVNLPFKQNYFDKWLIAIEKLRSLPLLTRKSFEKSPFVTGLDVSLFKVDNKVTAIIQLRPTLNTDLINRTSIYEELAELLDEQAVLLDIKEAANTIYQNYLNQIILMSALGVLAISLILLLIFRSLSVVAQILIPLIFAIACVVASLHILGISLTLIHVIGLLLIFAVGSNYALFFSQQQSNATLVSLMYANITTVIGYGILAFSSTPVLQAIGITVGPGTFLALIFSALISQLFKKRQ